MRQIHHDFVELDSDKSFRLLGKSLGGFFRNTTLYFDNDIAKGEIIKNAPDDGLWVRKWQLTAFQKVVLHKLPAPAGDEKKFNLIYFLNPSLFDLQSNMKGVKLTCLQNTMFFSGNAAIDFSVVPKKPFYVLDIAFTASWLLQQFDDAEGCFINGLKQYVNQNTQTVLTEPCGAEEYKTLRELEVFMQAGKEPVLFIRSRIYNLICGFFTKLFNRNGAERMQSFNYYEQIVRAETMIMENIKKPPGIKAIAGQVNMSISSLLRHFKLMYGKSIYEYHLEKKMEIAKKMILEKGITVKEMAEMLGYKQASPFIEVFTKQHGSSPGSFKTYK